MKNKISLFVGILILALIAAGAYFWATGMISSNYAYRSPLKDSPPAPGQPLGKPSTNRVVIVLIDALRYDTSLKTNVMPTLNQLRQMGSSALMHSEPPSFSEPGYSTILTGAWPELNDGPAFNLDYADIPTFTQDDLFSAAHRAGLKTAISGYYWFEKLVPQTSVDFHFYTPGEDKVADRAVLDAALPWLSENNSQLVLIHIDQVDYAGHHEGGPQSPNWDAAATRADLMLKEILAKMDLSKDTIVVLSDHGQIDQGGHGGQDPIVLREPFVIAGAGVKTGVTTDILMVDVAPTLAALLGTNLPASAQGEARVDLLTLPESVIKVLPEATTAQQNTLLTDYAKAIGAKLDSSTIPTTSNVNDYQYALTLLRRGQVTVERVWRAIPAAIVLAFGVFLFWRFRKQGAIRFMLGGLLFFLLFNLRYTLLDQKVYSLSSIISQMDLIMYIAITSAVSVVIVWILIGFWNKSFGKKPLRAGFDSLFLGYSIIFIAFLPVLLSFVLNGATVLRFLPDYLTSFLALLGLIQILVVSASTILLTGISSLLSILRKKKPF